MSYIEDIIRNEVQNIANMQSVPDEDLPTAEPMEAGLQEVPAHDLPDTVLGDYGMTSDNMVQNDTTLSQIQAGRGVEPNEALENSAIDPLTGALLGAAGTGLVSESARFISRGANRYANKIPRATPGNTQKILDDAYAKIDKDGIPVMPAQQVIQGAERLSGMRIPFLSGASEAVGSVIKFFAKPFTEQSRYKFALNWTAKMKKAGYTDDEIKAIWGQLESRQYIGNPAGTREFDEMDKGVAMDLFNDGSRAVDGAIRNRAKQSATNKLFGYGANTIGIKEMPPRKRISEPRTSIGNGGGVLSIAALIGLKESKQ